MVIHMGIGQNVSFIGFISKYEPKTKNKYMI